MDEQAKPERFMTTREVRELLRVHQNTISRMVRVGELHPMRLSGPNSPMRFERSDVERLIERRRHRTRRGPTPLHQQLPPSAVC